MKDKYINVVAAQVILPYSRDQVFEFFSKAENLELITPSWLKFNIMTPTPVEMFNGQLIDYKLKLFGLPFKWKTEITVWDPPNRFIDTQLKGPYVSWVHEHRFVEQGEKTVVYDKVEYKVPGWILSPIINKLFVRSNVEQIFKYRTKVIQEIFKSLKTVK